MRQIEVLTILIGVLFHHRESYNNSARGELKAERRKKNRKYLFNIIFVIGGEEFIQNGGFVKVGDE